MRRMSGAYRRFARWIETDVKTPEGYAITVASVYVHAGNTDDPTKMEQKYRFLDTMLKRMGALRDEAAHGGKQAVLCGDFNIAHTPLDIKNAKANEKHAGFLPEERAYVDKWLDEYEFVDVMRSLATHDHIRGMTYSVGQHPKIDDFRGPSHAPQHE